MLVGISKHSYITTHEPNWLVLKRLSVAGFKAPNDTWTPASLSPFRRLAVYEIGALTRRRLWVSPFCVPFCVPPNSANSAVPLLRASQLPEEHTVCVSSRSTIPRQELACSYRGFRTESESVTSLPQLFAACRFATT